MACYPVGFGMYSLGLVLVCVFTHLVYRPITLLGSKKDMYQKLAALENVEQEDLRSFPTEEPVWAITMFLATVDLRINNSAYMNTQII